MKTVYFVRHGESEANANGLMAGREYESPLTENGKQQAKKAGQYLKGKGIELIMVSPMERAKQTAEEIAKELGLDKSKIVESELVIERAYGSYSGRDYSIFKRDAEAGQIDESQLETPEDLYNRVKEAFKWLAVRPEKVILVVSHGATGRMFRLVDQKIPHSDFHTIKRFENAEIDEFTI